MSFRKRNTVLSTAQPGQIQQVAAPPKTEKQLAPGLRPSPLDGRLATSTGTASLDQLLAGHAGLPMGTCLLIEEQGTTDFSGILLRYYGAEGLVQGHHVHTLGMSQAWRYDLPGVADPARKGAAAKASPAPEEEMKIAWRYKALANSNSSNSPSLPRTAPGSDGTDAAPFCHSFDLSKRLAVGSCTGVLHTVAAGDPMALDATSVSTSPFKRFIQHLRTSLASSGPAIVHRVVVPGLLSPSMYPPTCSRPAEVLAFLHALRALLRQHATRLTAMVTLSAALFPRTAGLTRWIELLCDGVVELVPLSGGPAGLGSMRERKRDGDAEDDHGQAQAQGMVVVHTLPVYHEKGGGGGGGHGYHFRENLSFSLSASRGLVIRPYSLPPLDGENQKEKSPASTVKDGIDF